MGMREADPWSAGVAVAMGREVMGQEPLGSWVLRRKDCAWVRAGSSEGREARERA